MDELNTVLTHLKKGNVFLTGGAGVGKSYLTKEIIREYQKNRKSVVTLGSTGIAAVNIGGYTIHSFMLFGISSNFEELKKYDKRAKKRLKELYNILRNVDLLVIDEISMVSAELLDMVLYRLREGRFRGRILLVGDFFQLPPVMKKRDKTGIFDAFTYAFESSAWEEINPKIIELTVPRRTKDFEFVKILKKIRVGESDKEVISFLQKLLTQEEIKDKEATVLFGTNKEANLHNEKNLKRIKKPLKTKEAEVVVHQEGLSDTKLSSWIKNLPVEYELKIKENSRVLFTANKKDDFYNGERGKVLEIEEDRIVVEKENGFVVEVEPYEYKYSLISFDEKSDEIKEEILAVLKQYPLKSAYGITIHKSQGMSINNLVCDVSNIFEKSQFYVALSRASDTKNLKIVYKRGNFENYIKRIIRVDESVKEFYQKSDILKLSEFPIGTLFEEGI